MNEGKKQRKESREKDRVHERKVKQGDETSKSKETHINKEGEE